MTPINPNYYALGLQTPAFKANEKNKAASVTTNPVPQPNVSFKGTEALAAYNYNLLNKNNDFDIPLVKPIIVPDNIEEIKGERIYNSSGNLVEIVNEDENFRYIYEPGNEYTKYSISVFDKETNKLVKTQNEWKYDNNHKPEIYVREYIDSHTEYCTEYDKETLEPTWCNKTTNTDNEEKNISYNFGRKKYCVTVHDKIKNITKSLDYDKDKFLIEESISKQYNEHLRNMEKPQLHPKFDLNFDTKQLDGDKKYYSNGVIEKIIVYENGQKVTYGFNTKGKLNNIEKNNLTIYYSEDDNEQIIEENLGDGKLKKSIYNSNGTTSCHIENNGHEQSYYFDKNGNLVDYYEVQML